MLYQATNNAFSSPPQWFDEGLATYWQENWPRPFLRYALELVANGAGPFVADAEWRFPIRRGRAMASYAFSLTAVMYILDTWGDEGMSQVWRA